MNVEKMIYDGIECLCIDTELLTMIVTIECGPRIAFLGRKGEKKNILYWDKDGISREGWKLYGGHRVWLTRPMADESEDTYASDNDPCTYSQEGEYVIITAPPHKFTKLSRGMRIRVINERRFEVTNFIENKGNLLYSGGVWSPTCINPENKIIHIPLGEDHVTWDLVKIVIPRIFAGNRVSINDPQITFTEDEMVIKSQGKTTKRCVKAPKGLIFMDWPEEKIRFSKESSYIHNGNYPLDGCNLAVFIGENNFMGEMESYGIEQSIRPGETITNKEIWTVEDLRE